MTFFDKTQLISKRKEHTGYEGKRIMHFGENNFSEHGVNYICEVVSVGWRAEEISSWFNFWGDCFAGANKSMPEDIRHFGRISGSWGVPKDSGEVFLD